MKSEGAQPCIYMYPFSPKPLSHPGTDFYTGYEVGFPGGSTIKKLAVKQEIWGSIPGLEDPLEEGMATNSSTLAWRIL